MIMNIALIYRGFYKRDGLKSNHFDNTILENQIESIKSLNVKNIDIYFHTYSYNEEYDQNLVSLLNKYNLKKYYFENEKNPKISHSIIESLKLVDATKYDLIINTRFDLIFIKPLSDVNININKLNIPFKDKEKMWNKIKKVSDLIYLFPPKYMNKLIASLVNSTKQVMYGNKNSSGHLIYKLFYNSFNNITFMIDGFFSSNTDICENNFIVIRRNN